jgi:ribosomal protein S18 acetylase RimI-like enzyme
MHTNNIKNLALLCQTPINLFHTPTTSGFTSNCLTLAYHNRVFVENNFDLTELTVAKQYHPTNPYTLWLSTQNVDAKRKLTPDLFDFCISWPVMMLDLHNLPTGIQDSHLVIREVLSDDEIRKTWAPMVLREYNTQLSQENFDEPLQDWHTFFTYLQNSGNYKNMHFYLGFWDNTPAATGLFITQGDNIYLHWIGCMPQFRRRGIGAAITSFPLEIFKKQGIKKAFLFASVMGKPLYEKLGFTIIGAIEVYKTKM